MELLTTSTSKLSISPSEANYETQDGFTYRVDPSTTLSITGCDNETREYKKEEANHNGPQQLSGRHSEHKPHEVQGEKVFVDRGQQTGHNSVGTTENSRMQHRPVQVGTVRGLLPNSQADHTESTAGIRRKVEPAPGETLLLPDNHARGTVWITYDPDKRKFVRKEE